MDEDKSGFSISGYIQSDVEDDLNEGEDTSTVVGML
jgi:hypothetical protein